MYRKVPVPVDGSPTSNAALAELRRIAPPGAQVRLQVAHSSLEDRLGERYLRLDAEWPPEAGLGIDVANASAVKTLRSLAGRTLRELDDEALRSFLEPA